MAKKNAVELALAVGTIVYNSWGYEQTNIDFYEVMSATKHFVTLRRLNQITTETGFMCGPTEPILKSYRNAETTRHSVRRYGDEASISFRHGVGRVWNGTPQSCSWYA
jgi:hypothetical protein